MQTMDTGVCCRFSSLSLKNFIFHRPGLVGMWGVVGDVALDGGKYLWKHFPITTIRVVNMPMDPVADDVHLFTTWSLDEQSHIATSGVALDIA